MELNTLKITLTKNQAGLIQRSQANANQAAAELKQLQFATTQAHARHQALAQATADFITCLMLDAGERAEDFNGRSGDEGRIRRYRVVHRG